MNAAIGAMKALKERFPQYAPTLGEISALAAVVDGLPFDPFLEPVSLIEIHAGKRALANMSAGHVTAWAQHVAYATRARMRTLETSILEEIAVARLTASATLLRAHLETAALAAHAVLTVRDAGESGDTRRLDEVMRATLFGTSLFKEVDKVPDLEDHLYGSQQGTGRAADYLLSLDRFLEPDAPPGARHRLRYALLCEWGHPNLGGFKGFSRVVEEREGGWVIQYGMEEDLGTQGPQMVLEYLLEDMRLGYAAAELLRLSGFIDEGDGLHCRWPAKSDMRRIWTEFMRLP